MMFTCVSMVLSLTIFAYILGEISNLVMDQDAELVKTRSQVRPYSTWPYTSDHTSSLTPFICGASFVTNDSSDLYVA